MRGRSPEVGRPHKAASSLSRNFHRSAAPQPWTIGSRKRSTTTRLKELFLDEGLLAAKCTCRNVGPAAGSLILGAWSRAPSQVGNLDT